MSQTRPDAGENRGGSEAPTRSAFIPAPPAPDEEERIKALRSLNLLDTGPEARFDRIVRLASRLFGAPMVFVSLIDRDRQWFKARVGIDVPQTPRDISFCSHAILHDTPLIVPDATRDARFAGNPFVVGEPHIRFYAGRPLRTKGGQKIGTLCIADKKPRDFGDHERATLEELASLIERELELVDVIRMQDEMLAIKQRLLDSQRDLARLYSELQQEQAKSDRLLLNILPHKIARELKDRGRVEAVHHDEVAVMFTDFAGFTQVSESCRAGDLIADLNACFSAFDAIAIRHGIEKLKTIGDGYLAAAGLAEPSADPATPIVRAALEIRDWIANRQAAFEKLGKPCWGVRIGIHMGPIVAGVIGESRFSYDIWGDTVNTAARLQAASEPGRINVSQAIVDRLGPAAIVRPRGAIAAKGKGEMPMFFIEGLAG